MTCFAALLGTTASACLVTDPIEFEEDVDQPPVIIDDKDYPNGSIIKFERTVGDPEDMLEGPKEFVLRLTISDQNVDQKLEVRTVITRGDEPKLVYSCDEPPLPTGSVLRPYNIVIPQTSLVPRTCHRIDVVVSGHFDPCRRSLPAEKRAAYQDDITATYESDVARATYWVWDVSDNPLLNDQMITQELAKSCETISYVEN